MTRAGGKQTLLKLQIGTDEQSSSGAISRTWADVIDVWADIKSPIIKGDGTTAVAGQIATDSIQEAVIWWRPDVFLDGVAKYRLTDTNFYTDPPTVRVMEILSVNDVDGRRRELALRVKIRDAGGFRGQSA